MFTKLGFVVSCLHVVFVHSADGRFETADELPKAPADLQYAFIIIRNGIHVPITNVYSTRDGFDARWGKDVYHSSLTEVGKQLMKHVGKSLKTRYSDILPDNYDQNVMEVTSNAVSLLASNSVKAIVRGMFPSSGDVQPGTLRPDPQKVSSDKDKSLILDNCYCTRYTTIRDAIIRESKDLLSTSQKQVIAQVRETLKPTGILNPSTLADFFAVWDTLYMEIAMGMQMLQSVTDMMPQLTELAIFSMWSRMCGKIDADNHSILQYHTGPLLFQILAEMSQQHTKCSGSSGNGANKCVHFHLHGTTNVMVNAVFWALVDQNLFMSNPGDALMLEVDSQQRVKAYLYSPLKSDGDKMTELSLKKELYTEEGVCTLQQLEAGWNNLGLSYSQDDWEQKCNDQTSYTFVQWRSDIKDPFRPK